MIETPFAFPSYVRDSKKITRFATNLTFRCDRPLKSTTSPAHRCSFPIMKSLLAFVFLIPVLAQAADWTRFRGPNGSGISDTEVPLKWSESENLKWKAALPGPGSSSPIVAKGKVFVTCFSGYGPDGGGVDDLVRHLVCVDRSSGSILWDKKVKAELPEDPYQGFLREHGYASNTPVTDGKRVYAFYGKSGVHAYDFDGKKLWSKNLGKDSTRKRWGSAASPIVVGDLLVINAGEEARAIFGLDPKTGEEKWKAEGDSLAYAYGTPAMMKRSNGQEDLVLPVPGEIWGLNPASGKLRWFAETGITGNVSTSVTFLNDVAFVFGGFPRTARAAVRVKGKGDLCSDATIWEETRSSYVPTPIVHGDKLYWVSDTGYAMCADTKSGELLFQERLEGAQGGRSRGKPFYASPVLVSGNLYAVSRTGGTFVIEAKPKFKLLAQNKLADDESQFNGTPAVCEGNLFLRSDAALYCIGK